MLEFIRSRVNASIDLKSSLLSEMAILGAVERTVEGIVQAYKNNGKVLWCGNGGSAADAQHLAAELSGHNKIDHLIQLLDRKSVV